MTTVVPTAWRRSRRCSNAACVEVAEDDKSFVLVRDSKESAGEILAFDRGAWAEFITGLKTGLV